MKMGRQRAEARPNLNKTLRRANKSGGGKLGGTVLCIFEYSTARKQKKETEIQTSGKILQPLVWKIFHFPV